MQFVNFRLQIRQQSGDLIRSETLLSDLSKFFNTALWPAELSLLEAPSSFRLFVPSLGQILSAFRSRSKIF